MNYRRGLGRLYAVLAIAWIAIAAFMVISDRWVWEPWRIAPMTWGDVTQARSDGTVVFPAGMTLTKEDVLVAAPSTKLLWSAALGLPIPLLGYLVLFCAAPWIYRGFRS